MAYKNNFKMMSHLTILLITAIFIAITFDRAIHIYQHYAEENESHTELIANSTESYFRQIDMILDLVGEQLLKDDNYKDIDNAKSIFDRMLSINPSIMAYALISPEGNYLLTHLDTPPESIPSVLTRAAAKDSFLKTIRDKKMVIGRTYFLNQTEEFAIPVRKAFYDNEGKVIAVMAVGIDANNSEILPPTLSKSYGKVVQLYRDEDRYRQLYISNVETLSPTDLYDQPISEQESQQILTNLQKRYSDSVEAIKNNGITVSFEMYDQLDATEYFVSTKYIKRLELWASSYIKLSDIHTSILVDSIKIFFLYLIIVFIVYGLFRRIERAEAQKHKELEYQAFHDSLTGLKNRNFLQNREIELFTKRTSCSCLLININGMKLINDIYSHRYGDDFISIFARRLFDLSPNGSEVIRLNGDEFLVVLSFHGLPEKGVAEFKRALEKSITVQNIVINFTISVGVAHYPNDTNEIDQLVSYADMALHAAKQEKGSIVHFDNVIKEHFVRRALIEKHIPQAIKQHEITLVYQPQLRYPDQLYGVEALVRWNSPELGFVSPPELISVAEGAGLMPKLGEFIIDQACKEMSGLKKRRPISFQLSLNISAKQFMHEGFIAYLLSSITQYELSAKDITLELTESIFVHDIKQLVHTLHLLKAEGFKISMDDFGTGFSSLSMLRKIPLNEIKIDKSFVDDVTTDQSAEYVTKTILLIANQLGYEAVIAEGAETKEQIEKLVGQGCNIFQGYYFSKPIDIQQLESYIGT